MKILIRLLLVFFAHFASAHHKVFPNTFMEMLAYKFAPEIRLHEHEEFPFTSVESYLEHVGLGVFRHGRFDVLLKPGQVNAVRLEQLYFEYKSKLEPAMRKTDEDGFIGDLCFFLPSDRSVISPYARDPVCYAYPRYVDEDNVIDISYIFFHPFNGEVFSHHPCLSRFYDKLGAGAHSGDFEHITVRTNLSGTRILGIFYAAHGPLEGKWYEYKNDNIYSSFGYKVKDNTHPLTWCALNTHGNHNHPGIIDRALPIPLTKVLQKLGIFADITSDHGEHVDCRKILKVIHSKDDRSFPWLKFRGRFGVRPVRALFGVKGPDGPAFKDWWPKEPS